MLHQSPFWVLPHVLSLLPESPRQRNYPQTKESKNPPYYSVLLGTSPSVFQSAHQRNQSHKPPHRLYSGPQDIKEKRHNPHRVISPLDTSSAVPVLCLYRCN